MCVRFTSCSGILRLPVRATAKTQIMSSEKRVIIGRQTSILTHRIHPKLKRHQARGGPSTKNVSRFTIINMNKGFGQNFKVMQFLSDETMADQNTGRAHFWNFLRGVVCTGNLAFRLRYLFAIIHKISKLVSQQRQLSGLGVGVVVTGWCKLKVRALVEIYTKFVFSNDFYFSFVRHNGLQ